MLVKLKRKTTNMLRKINEKNKKGKNWNVTGNTIINFIFRSSEIYFKTGKTGKKNSSAFETNSKIRNVSI